MALDLSSLFVFVFLELPLCLPGYQVQEIDAFDVLYLLSIRPMRCTLHHAIGQPDSLWRLMKIWQSIGFIYYHPYNNEIVENLLVYQYDM